MSNSDQSTPEPMSPEPILKNNRFLAVVKSVLSAVGGVQSSATMENDAQATDWKIYAIVALTTCVVIWLGFYLLASIVVEQL